MVGSHAAIKPPGAVTGKNEAAAEILPCDLDASPGLPQPLENPA